MVASSGLEGLAFLQYNDGTVQRYRLGGFLEPQGSLPTPCPRMLALPPSSSPGSLAHPPTLQPRPPPAYL